ncbi:ABC transporter substrate-binding protein [Edaphobacter sp. HDX4]|uniref:ABC transporter substrate-binding protein n=1 Tax=Edaphobacter sp. HDX4 TaxID=2794064 RepID=UPI002FE5B963
MKPLIVGLIAGLYSIRGSPSHTDTTSITRVRRLPCCSDPAFDVSVSSGETDAEVRRRLRAGDPLYQIHADLIRALQPDLVIKQMHCDVCVVTGADVERTGACALETRQIALSTSSVEGIFHSIRLVARALGVEERREDLVRREQRRLQVVAEKTARFSRKSVGMIEWTDPVFVMANWAPELIETANGEPVLGRKGEYSIAVDGNKLLEFDPEYLIIAPCGFNLERSLAEQSRLEQYPWGSQLQAVRSGSDAFADGNLFFNRGGMTIAQSAEIVAEVLHGVSFHEILGIHWRPMETAVEVSARKLIESPF